MGDSVSVSVEGPPSPAHATPDGAWPWLLRVALFAAPLCIVIVYAESLAVQNWLAGRGPLFGVDFIDFWTAARLLLEGRAAEIYDPAAFVRAATRLGGGLTPGLSAPYPPNLFPLIVWIGALPYTAAYALWCAIGGAGALAAAWPRTRRLAVAAAILFSPAVVYCIYSGQCDLFVAALVIAGLRLADRRPILAGALIGLAAFKPQLGLLIPLALIAAGRWRVVAAAMVSVAAMAGLGTLLTGAESWALYITRTLPFQSQSLHGVGGVWRTLITSPLSLALDSGLPSWIAWSFQAAVTAACAGAVIAAFRRLKAEGRPIGSVEILILAAAGFLATPYSFVYDMPALMMALMLVSLDRPELDQDAAWRWASFVLWITPIVTIVGGGLFYARLHLGWFGAGALLAVVCGGLVLRFALRASSGSRGVRPRMLSA